MSEPIPFNEVGVLKRHPDNPLLTRADAPYPCSLLYNAGIAKFQGRYVMVFRNDYGAAIDRVSAAKQREQKLPTCEGTNLGLAFSDDGIRWKVEPKPCIDLETARKLIAPHMPGKNPEQELFRFYDPRLTVLDGRLHMCFAVGTANGIRGGVAVTDDFHNWEVMSVSVPDNRNMVLFPEKIGGRYVRLERPVDLGGVTGINKTCPCLWL